MLRYILLPGSKVWFQAHLRAKKSKKGRFIAQYKRLDAYAAWTNLPKGSKVQEEKPIVDNTSTPAPGTATPPQVAHSVGLTFQQRLALSRQRHRAYARGKNSSPRM